MEKKYFTLGAVENNRTVKILQVCFGIVCIAVAIFWLFFNPNSLKSDKTPWITVIFLTGFGIYMIWSGAGQATRFIEISGESIALKKNVILPPVKLMTGDIEKIDFFPLSVIFHFRSKKRTLLRFGTLYYETNEKIVDELISFAELNNIPFEIIEEKI